MTYATARATASGDIANFCAAFWNSSLSLGLFTCSLNAVSVKTGQNRTDPNVTCQFLPQSVGNCEHSRLGSGVYNLIRDSLSSRGRAEEKCLWRSNSSE